MKGEIIRKKLINGERIYGTHIASLGNPLAARLTSDVEMDFVFICTEHMPIDRTEVAMMCQLYSAWGISPMVRIPYPSAHWACMAMDGGAEGIVAPYVETVEQVEELVGAVKYRPIKGKFLQDIFSGERKPAVKLKNYIENFNKDKYLIIGVESVEAINNLESLISVEGVDGVFLGPHDITCSMEIPEEYENPLFLEALIKVVRTCRKMNKGVGLHMDASSDIYKILLHEGLNYVLNAADVTKMRGTLNGDFRRIREIYGDTYERGNATLKENNLCISKDGKKKKS